MAAIKTTVRLDNLKKLEKNIQKNTLSQTAANKFAELLKQSIDERTSNAASGNLARSVNVKKRGRYGSGVYADYYFWYANYGRGPGRKPKEQNKITTWAGRAGWNEAELRKHIAEFGTTKRLFYETAKAKFKEAKPRIYKQIKKR